MFGYIAIHGFAGSGKDTVADWVLARYRSAVKRGFADAIKEFVAGVFPDCRPEYLWGSSHERGALISSHLAEDALDEVETFVQSLLSEEQRRDLPFVARVSDALVKRLEEWERRGLVSVREILQIVGTEWGRETIGPNVWTDALFRHVEEVHAPRAIGWKDAWGVPPEPWATVVIPDVRFQSEVEAVRARTGFLLKIRRDVGRKGEEEKKKVRTPVGGVAGHASEAGLDDALFHLVIDAPEGVDKLGRLLDLVFRKEDGGK